MRVLSLGAGVQSTTLALMAAAGEIAAPDCAIFADTGWEPREVYAHLDKLEHALPFPLYRVSSGNIRDDIVAKNTTASGRFPSVPWHTRDPETGKRGMAMRQCTYEYKLLPIYKKIRELLGHNGRGRVRGQAEMLIGISVDEITRMKPARVKYIINTWPLIDLGMSRRDCERWLERAGWTAPKSSCIGCPFHSDAHWRRLRDTSPDEWADAVEIDRIIRNGGSLRGIRAQQFMHKSLKPLDEVDLRLEKERGQPDLFANECEGMCGV